ncbi:MAG: phage portal protein [Pseudomonadota bacterium]
MAVKGQLGRMRRWMGRVAPGDDAGETKAAGAGEAKSGAGGGAMVMVQGLGEAVWSPRNYGGMAREGFMRNAIVYRAVRMIAEAAAAVPLVVHEGREARPDDPLQRLIDQPAAGQCAADLFECWYGYLLVSGNAYLEAVTLADEVRALHVLRPDRMQIVPGRDGWPAAYDYTVDHRTHRYAGEALPGVAPVLHLKLFHPHDDHYGMSPIEAAAGAIDIHNAATRWNKALLDNSARPSGALVYAAREGTLSDEQFERLRQELDAGFQGAARAGRPMLLDGGLDWKSMSMTPKDMDFIEAKHVAAREIALALGVPPMLLGIPGDNTYSNYQEATRTFWRQTVLPLVGRTAAALSGWLAPAYGVNVTLKPDLDQVQALALEREALWSRIERASFLSEDEKRAAVGYGPAA